MARQATDDNIIRRVRFACWIEKATDELRICNIYFFSTAAVITRERLNVTLIRIVPVLYVNIHNYYRNFKIAYVLSFCSLT